jgi:hypothetical protein
MLGQSGSRISKLTILTLAISTIFAGAIARAEVPESRYGGVAASRRPLLSPKTEARPKRALFQGNTTIQKAGRVAGFPASQSTTSRQKPVVYQVETEPTGDPQPLQTFRLTDRPSQVSQAGFYAASAPAPAPSLAVNPHGYLTQGAGFEADGHPDSPRGLADQIRVLQLQNEDCLRQIANLTQRLDALQRELTDTREQARRTEESWQQTQKELVRTRDSMAQQQLLVEDALKQLESNEEAYFIGMNHLITRIQTVLRSLQESESGKLSDRGT